MSHIVSATAPITGAHTVKKYPGFGILGADLPATGDNGGSPALNDGINPASEYHWRVETPPSAGALTIYPDLSAEFDADGIADGYYPWVYRLFEDGTDQGTATVSQTVGSAAVVSPDVSVEYLIKNSITADMAAAFNLRGSVQASAASAYLLRAEVSRADVSAYQIRSAAVADCSAAYLVRNAVSMDSADTFAIRSSIVSDSSSAYSIDSAASVASSHSATYVIRAAVQLDCLAAYHVRASLSADLAAAFSIRGSAAASIVTAYNMDASISAVSAELTTAYGVDGIAPACPTAAEIVAEFIAHPNTLTVQKFLGLK